MSKVGGTELILYQHKQCFQLADCASSQCYNIPQLWNQEVSFVFIQLAYISDLVFLYHQVKFWKIPL